MSITYTFEVSALERMNNESSGVIEVSWRILATDGEFDAQAYGRESFEPDPSSPNFIPYDSITPAHVVAWVTEKWGQDKLQGIKDDLAKRIEDQKNPATLVDTIWKHEPI